MRTLWSFLVVAAFSSFAWAEAPDNFTLCMNGEPGCDYSVLSQEQRLAVAKESGRNFSACVHETAGCNPSRLTPIQRKTIALQSGRNFAACVHGEAHCDVSRLTAEQLRTMATLREQADRKGLAAATPQKQDNASVPLNESVSFTEYKPLRTRFTAPVAKQSSPAKSSSSSERKLTDEEVLQILEAYEAAAEQRREAERNDEDSAIAKILEAMIASEQIRANQPRIIIPLTPQNQPESTKAIVTLPQWSQSTKPTKECRRDSQCKAGQVCAKASGSYRSKGVCVEPVNRWGRKDLTPRVGVSPREVQDCRYGHGCPVGYDCVKRGSSQGLCVKRD